MDKLSKWTGEVMRFSYGTPNKYTQDELRIELGNPTTIEVWCYLDGVSTTFKVPVKDMMKLLGVGDENE